MTQESTGRTPTDPPLAPEVALPGGRRPTTSSTRIDPMLGRRLGSYEILSRVARGGMGVVYRARHVYIDKIVAVKVLDPALAGRDDLIERFRTEAQSLARVEHENVVKVIDIIEDKGVHGIVMDFAEGVNLRQLVKDRGPLQPEDLLSVARQTAEALFSAHREGILHRDIKPENLIRNSRGRCKLADFGLAGDLRLIAEGHEGPLNFGTPAYSAPEVLRRMVPDKRSDIFSFGATMYHLAAGEPPFGQSGMSQIMLSQTQGARPLEARRPDIPPKLCKLLMECIALHPKDRPESFAEILERLPRRAHNRPPGASTEPTDLLATASGPLPLAPNAARKWQVPAALVAAAALAAILSAWWFSGAGRPVTNEVSVLPDSNQSALPDPEPAGNQPATNAPGPLFLPHEQAFAAAELGSRTALARADYSGAWQAFAAFLQAHPDAPDAPLARQRQSAVRTRVEELRDLAWQAALQGCESALAASRTADALAALDNFPAELLKPLWATEDIKAERLLQTQRELVLGREQAELAGVLKRAEELQLEWKEAIAAMPPTPDARALRAAANRLAERELLLAFLPGRTSQAREVVNLRLAELRRSLEAEHQAARAAPVAWRQFCARVRPEWARQALAIRTDVDAHLAERKFEAARDRIDSHLAVLARARASAAQTAPLAVGKRIAEQRELEDLLARWRDDIVQAEKCNLAILGALRRNRLTGANMTYRFHAGLDEKGRRLPRTDSHTGKVMTVGARDFEVDGERGRATIRLDLLTVECVRDLVKVSTNFEEQFSLVSWLFALGRTDLASAEADRLQRKAGVPEDIARRTSEMAASGMLSPFPQRRLQFMVAMATGAGFEPAWDARSLESRLLAAQRDLAVGAAGAAEGYLALVRDLTEPELVHLESLQTALDATNAGAADRRLLALLEPWEPRAHAQLARALAEADQRDPARHAARLALLLDPSHEEAFAVLRELDR